MNLSTSTPGSSSTSASNSGVANQFPVGLRVLIVDDDPAFLMILERMLRDCLYEVTKCERAEVALSLLRENTNGFDIVLSDVHMPDMDGFKLMEHIGSEMELPVIMMSADDEKNVVMKGVTDGACDYLIKPVSIETLKNIWQHVVRKRKNQEQSGGPRVVWSVELHRKFVDAVNQLGIDEAVPQRILELMNVPGLTRANVASHLQKYRLYLRRLSGVSQQQGNLNNSFISPQESTFGATSINGFDLQASLRRMRREGFNGVEEREREERGRIQIDIVFGT